MFVTEKLVYLQLQKTASTHIVNLLKHHVGGEYIAKHAAMERRPATRLIVGSIRNPLDWYVSLWAHGCRNRGALRNNLLKRHHWGYRMRTGLRHPYRAKDVLSGIWSEFNKPVGEWTDLYQQADEPEKFRRWLKTILAKDRRFDVCEGFAETGVWRFAGYMTYRYLRVYSANIDALYRRRLYSLSDLYEFDSASNVVDSFIRVEQLEKDFLATLEKAGYEVSPKIKEDVRGAMRTNASVHANADTYYDEECRALIMERERFLFDKHFPFLIESVSPRPRVTKGEATAI